MPNRKVWFITRPERDPKFHIEALEALSEATENFNEVWARNRIIHKRYEKVLGSFNLKRDNISADGSGGRTWAAMLRTFGYVYIDESGFLHLTKVGKKLLQSEKVRENITKQIVTLQIPNAYFLESGFRPKFDEGFQIRPAQFLIRLVAQTQLDYYVTKEEITFFALTAKRDNEIQSVTQQILNFRNSSHDEKEDLKRSVANIYDHRERSDKGARDFASAHGDVAHTFMLLSDYTGLVDYIRGDALRLPSEKRENTIKQLSELAKRYPFNKRYLISLQRFSEHAGLDVDSFKASNYGSNKPATNLMKNQNKIQKLLAPYPVLQSLSHEEITSILEQQFSRNEAERFATMMKEEDFKSINDEFVEGYVFEENDRIFEDKTAEVLRAIGFKVDLRPKPSVANVRTEIEILLHLNEKDICIIDAKNYKKKFVLNAHLASHMASEYIPNYNGYEGKKVTHFGYITANEWGGERNLEKISNKALLVSKAFNVQGALISARALLGFLDFCIDNDVDKTDRIKLFINCFTNKGYRSVSEMISSERHII